MFRMKFVARSLAVAAIAAACAVPAFADWQVANSTDGSRVALAPINLVAIQNGINNAQSTANNANNTANVAYNTAGNAQSTANWAGQVAVDAQSNAAKGVAWADAAWWYAWEAASASCAATMGGAMWRPFCEAQQRPHPN